MFSKVKTWRNNPRGRDAYLAGRKITKIEDAEPGPRGGARVNVTVEVNNEAGKYPYTYRNVSVNVLVELRKKVA